MVNVYIGLVHSPIYNKNYETVATAVTNLDIHDIARSAATYGVSRYFIIHPLEQQQELVTQILEYWRDGFGALYNGDRKIALDLVELADSVENVQRNIFEMESIEPIIVTTDAREFPNTVSYQHMRKIIDNGERPVLILFGTGNGMTRELMAKFDYILEPVRSAHGYNHLCVRAAVAIILDRLLGC